MDVTPKFIPTNEIAKLIGRHPKNVVDLAKRGEIPLRKLGRRTGMLAEDLDNWLRNLPLAAGQRR